MIGHILTLCMLCTLNEIANSSTADFGGSESYTSNSTRDFYQDEMRNIREKEKLETLRQIERDLRYK